MAQVLVGMGSNIGDRAATLARAVDFLRALPETEVTRVSAWRETKPVGGPPQPAYLNGAVLANTSLAPDKLLAEMQRIEAELGRVRNEKWGPRTIDLDLLLYDSLQLATSELTIPHPRMHKRGFVLTPAAEIAPELRHPTTGLSVRQLLQNLNRPVETVTTIADLRARVAIARRNGGRIGLVPTMGALHDGHLSLVDEAQRECSFVVVTIFVNPTQFGPQEDYDRYPRMLDRDLGHLQPRGVDLVFAPAREEMYCGGHSTTVRVSDVTSRWEGAIRPGHFEGVATIVLKLFHAAQPDAAYFGQKDYQQCAVIGRMIRDLNLPIEMRICPTVRDADGLALSSRNAYLSPAERQRALSLSKALNVAREHFAKGESNAERLVEAMIGVMRAAPVDVDYAALVNPDTLSPVSKAQKGSVALVAARLPSTRLIDNCIL